MPPSSLPAHPIQTYAFYITQKLLIYSFYIKIMLDG